MARDAGKWPDPYQGAVSLCYDGSLPNQLDQVVPLLDSLAFAGTFFSYPPNLIEAFSGWRDVASYGHEIANGFLWGITNADGLVPQWPQETLETEFLEAEALLQPLQPGHPLALSHPSVRTSWGANGLPAIEDVVASVSLKLNEECLGQLSHTAEVVRTARQGLNVRADLRFKELKCYVADELDGDSLCMLAHIALSQGAWLILVFNAMRDSSFDAEAHEQFCRWLGEREQDLLIASVTSIAELMGPVAGEVLS
jgi:hypothetical protein